MLCETFRGKLEPHLENRREANVTKHGLLPLSVTTTKTMPTPPKNLVLAKTTRWADSNSEGIAYLGSQFEEEGRPESEGGLS